MAVDLRIEKLFEYLEMCTLKPYERHKITFPKPPFPFRIFSKKAVV